MKESIYAKIIKQFTGDESILVLRIVKENERNKSS